MWFLWIDLELRLQLVAVSTCDDLLLGLGVNVVGVV